MKSLRDRQTGELVQMPDSEAQDELSKAYPQYVPADEVNDAIEREEQVEVVPEPSVEVVVVPEYVLDDRYAAPEDVRPSDKDLSVG